MNATENRFEAASITNYGPFLLGAIFDFDGLRISSFEVFLDTGGPIIVIVKNRKPNRMLKSGEIPAYIKSKAKQTMTSVEPIQSERWKLNNPAAEPKYYVVPIIGADSNQSFRIRTELGGQVEQFELSVAFHPSNNSAVSLDEVRRIYIDPATDENRHLTSEIFRIHIRELPYTDTTHIVPSNYPFNPRKTHRWITREDDESRIIDLT